MPSLYVVATPIGNLEDITLRALRVLGEVGLIAAEDTRVTRKLLSRHGIHTRLTSYREHNRATKLPSLLSALEQMDVALVSDAGTPAISDPGRELVREASLAGIPVVSVPGPSAVTAAVAVSGLPLDRFLYLGFLPRKRSERQRALEQVASERCTLVILEAPHRLQACLEDLRETLGDRLIAVCRELTKLHEEVFRGPVSDALAFFRQPRGEFTLVITGAEETDDGVGLEIAQEILAALHQEGVGAKEAVSRAAKKSGMSRRELYRLWLDTKPPTDR